MSAEASNLLTFALPREEKAAELSFEEKLELAARLLLAGGEVTFKLSTRVHTEELPREKRFVYRALRILPRRFFVPPALAAQRGTFDWWDVMLRECKSGDDQVLVMPHNRTYAAGVGDLAVECRPLDPTDAERFRVLQNVFGHLTRPVAVECTPARRDYLVALLESLPAMDSRLRALEARVHALEGEGADASEIT